MRATTFVAGGMPLARLPLARLLPAAAAVAVLVLAVGCGGSPATPSSPGPGAAGPESPTVLRAATLQPGQPVPVPKGKRVLTLTGMTSAANQGRVVAFDRAGLDQLRLVQVQVHEPWVKQDLAFRGVWLQDLLEVAGAAAGVTTLHITALDDYQVDLTMTDVRAGGIMLATSAGDGSAIPVGKGGPTRIIFLNGVKSGANAEQWIWSLKTIDLR